MTIWNGRVGGSLRGIVDGRFFSSRAPLGCVTAAQRQKVFQGCRGGGVRVRSLSSTSPSQQSSALLARGVSVSTSSACPPPSRSWDAASTMDTPSGTRPHWSPEWKSLGLGATLVNEPFPSRLFFVQLGFGVDQHGRWETSATKAAIRAVRNAIEFNSIPGVISNLPGGRHEMRIHVRLGVPGRNSVVQPKNVRHDDGERTQQPPPDAPLPVDPLEVAKVFPYGKLLPIEVCLGGLAFHTGRVVEELGDANDVGVCVAACVSIGYSDGPDGAVLKESDSNSDQTHVTYSTRDGY